MGLHLNREREKKAPTFRSSVDELSGVHALDSDEILSVLLVFVLVSENDFGKRCATAWIVHNVLHKSLDVSLSLCEVNSSETGWRDSLRGVGLEDRALTTSLHSDDSSHYAIQFLKKKNPPC